MKIKKQNLEALEKSVEMRYKKKDKKKRKNMKISGQSVKNLRLIVGKK